MLCRVNFLFKPEESCGNFNLPGFGEALSNWLREQMSLFAPEQVAKIQEQPKKPFSLNLFKRIEGIYGFSLNTLTPAMLGFSSFLANNWNDRLFNPGSSLLRGLHTEACGLSTYEELLKLGGREKSLTLEFTSPTSFRHQGEQVLFPLPAMVFGSLYQQWNAWSTYQLPADLTNFFEKLRVSRYQLVTRVAPFTGYKIIGFQGRVEYALTEAFSEQVIKILHALGNFAGYAGVGYRPTVGLGATRYRQRKAFYEKKRLSRVF